ncbi:hypothetical protein [Alkalihalobacterium chitinilyticum]|uniref:DUF4885 domain-containing protein n=1 Tax=Alkalihalobacterium chitinilyticum TaxID=2980103 RepID=A0ABT5VGH2_9BACI|nr:hypothetical protein [Alkalihalobacterium chitinilyticum]MDE5414563.1 hypothetical protein [Alkalihalobacterium chitinilyticum]
MTTINGNFQHPQSLQKTYNKQKSTEAKGFKDYLELESTNTVNNLEDYNYSASIQDGLQIEKGQRDSNIQLPPDSAPEGLKKAFEKLSNIEKGRIILDIATKVRISNGFLTNNGTFNSSGNFKSELIDFFNQEDFSYVQFTDELIENWEKSKSYNTFESYQSRMNTYEKFKNALIENGVN